MGRSQTGGRAATDYIIDKTKNLKFTDVATIVHHVHNKLKGVGKPTIDVDASIYFYKFKDASNGPINELAAFLVAWAATGIDVTCVLDPLCGVRDDTKRASIKRTGDKLSKKLKAFEAKAKLIHLGHLVQNVKHRPDNFKLDETITEIRKQENIIKGADASNSSAWMTERLPELLSEALQSIDKLPEFGEIRVVLAKTQADSTISYRLLNGYSQVVLSSDMDYGHLCAERCIQVQCSFSSNRKKGADQIKDVEVSSPRKSLMKMVTVAIGRDQKTTFSSPLSPLFEHRSPWWRALIAVALGCDQCPKGVPQINIKDIVKWFKAFPKGTDAEFLEFLVNPPPAWTPRRPNPAFSKEYLVACAQAIVFEPGDIVGDTGMILENTVESKTLYLHRTPQVGELYAYCKAFASDPSMVRLDGPPTSACCGQPGDMRSTHTFFTEEGIRTCGGCHVSFCQFCVMKEDGNSGRYFCFSCYSDILVTRGIPVVEGPSHSEMLTFLTKECNQQAMDKASVLVVAEMYDAFQQKKIVCSPELKDHVKYPLLYPTQFSGLTTLCSFDLAEGGRFIRDESLTDNQRVDLLVMLSKLVKFGCESSHRKDTAKAVYSAVSDVLIRWMENCRYDSGFRLLERACRHAHDMKGPDLCQATGSIVQHEGQTCLRIDSKIRASMRDQEYQTCVVISENDLVACSCSCQAGSCGGERHADVHVGALLQKLSLLLFDGLGEHLLYESTAQWHQNEPLLSSTRKEDLLEAIGLLKLCGCELKQVEPIDKRAKISESLEKFNVGTDGVKEWKTPSLPGKGDKPMGPLREECFVSSGTSNSKCIAEAKKKSILDIPSKESAATADKTTSIRDGIQSLSTMNETTGPNYTAITLSINAVSSLLKPSQEHERINAVGYNLLDMRYCKEIEGTPPHLVQAMSKGLREDMRSAFAELSCRTRLATTSSKKEDAPDDDWEETPCLTVEGSPEECTNAERPVKKPRTAYGSYCSVASCCNNDKNYSGYFTRVPKGSPHVADMLMTKDALNTIARRNFIRCEFLERMGLGRMGRYLSQKDPMRCEIKYCSAHELEEVTKPITFKYNKKTRSGGIEEVKKQQPIRLTVLKSTGARCFHNPPATENKGLGNSRELTRRVIEIFKDKKDSVEHALQQSVEETAPDSGNLQPMNETVRRAAGYPVSEDVVHAKRPRSEGPEVSRRKRPWNWDPTINLTLDAKVVKMNTGFVNMFMLLRFVMVVCNGDLSCVKHRVTSLTWLEEWYLFFEWTWGRTAHRLAEIAFKYNISKTSVTRITRQKRKLVLHARQCWPLFASHEEDVRLRGEWWNSRYKDKRAVFWDDTNVNLPTPTDATLNRRTYSSYYSGNVGKGGVFIQLCGWLGNWYLWTGAVSDTYYLTNSGILEKQKDFAAKDTSNNQPFMNVMDKGYRCNAAAWTSGEQTILQPAFAKSDKQFTTEQLLSSAAIATDRGGNERAVNVCKRSGLIKRGLAPHGTMEDLDDAWLGWGFQSNFMYNPVL